MAKKTDLVIVESPAKAKTIEKYLGSGYKVVASMGHLRDLPKSKMGVDIEAGFVPNYIPVPGREDVIEDLRKRSKSAGTVYLATDPDREGEAISWHLKELLELPDSKARRVTFNEITKKVVQEGIANPRDIDQDLVDAQQARRILDRIVGYKLSPLLWRKVRRGLSAGRVQSAATRLVLDRENEIRAFKPEEYWHLDASLSRGKGGAMSVRYHGDGEKKRELRSESEVDEVCHDVENAPWTVHSVKRGERTRSPSPPFITSTLQQEASRRLNMPPRRTMSVAQQLYEGVDIEGRGTVGLITYMRTDSLRLSDDALSAAADYIRGRYGDAYYPGKPRTFKTKAGAQDAHEAIRPSDVNLAPEMVKQDLTPEQYRLYRLIWGRFTASQMSNAVYDNVSVDVESAGHHFRAGYSELKFPGYTAVYEEKSDEEEEIQKKPLPNLQEGEALELKKLSREQRFTSPPARYTEATLIRAMEEKGIGRPSTYAPTISNITKREYVAKEGKYLKPTSLGEVITQLMEEHFPDIVDLKFTARMEDELDKVEEGKNDWVKLLDDFYQGFAQEMDTAEKALEGKRYNVPDEVTDEICEKCGRNMVVKSGRFGRFLACPGYPECDFTKPLVVEMPGKCPKCGSRILKRTSKKGYTYYACEKMRNKEDQECDFMTWDVPVKDLCPECGKSMFKLSGKGQRKPFCVNPECPNFLPEEKRGYRKKTAATAAPAEENAPEAGEEKK
ncbi:MAG: type I DNA topoisomerase [Oscillospiraceae bacterium]|nr:type I DNA topoisomerase [bacterium]MDY5100522.1 type I DNA topoisomerase [Oscillospiraceae bacterium]